MRFLLSTLPLVLCTRVFSATWIVDAASPHSGDSADGSSERPFPTISQAAGLAQPGDIVLVRSGIYRERVSPARSGERDRPIIYRAERTGEAIVRGSENWSPEWKPLGSSRRIFSAAWDEKIFPAAQKNPFLCRFNENWKAGPPPAARPSPSDPHPLTLGQVFLSGLPLRQASSLEDLERSPGSWMTSPDGSSLLVHFPAKPGPVEVSIRSRIFAPVNRGLHDIQIEGFLFEHCANQLSHPQEGAVSTRSGRRWVLRKNTIRYAGTIGLDCGSEGWTATAVEGEKPGATRIIPGGEHLVEDNTISSNGLSGIAAWKISDSTFRRNIIERNNRLGFSPAAGILVWEMAGIKILNAARVVIEDNFVRDNEAFGIWIDNGYEDCRVSRNVVLNNHRAGIFIEYGMPAVEGENPDRVLIDTNIVAGTRHGDGIYAHDASGITVAQNLLAENAGFGIRMRSITDRISRNRVLTQTSDILISNNIFTANSLGGISLPMPSVRSRNVASNANLFLVDNWYAEHLSTRFSFENVAAVGQLKQIDKADVENLVKKYAAAANTFPDLGWIDSAIWKGRPSLNLAQWQKTSDWETQSKETGSLSLVVRGELPEIEVHQGKDLTLPPCSAIPGVDRDFSGQPLPSSPVIPGPFQNLLTMKTTIGLWPTPISQ